MKTAVITLSGQGGVVARPLAARLGECDVFVHRSVATRGSSERFDSIVALTRRVFSRYRRLVYIVPVGVVVRAIAPCAAHKLTDPAVVVVDVGARWAISLLSGHEGGANELAMEVANALSAECVVTTTTEALKTVIVGVGCRRGVPSATSSRPCGGR